MARFQGGKFGPETIKVRPLGWRGRLSGFDKWSFPYLIGSKVEFEMELVETTSGLFNFPFFVVNTASKRQERIPLNPAKHKGKVKLDWYSTPADGALQIWMGTPEGPDSINIVHADTWNPTNTIVGLIGVILGVIVKWVLDFLASLF